MSEGRHKFVLSALIPLVLLVALLFAFLAYGPIGVFKASFPPVEEIAFQRVSFEPNKITIEIMNDGPEPVTIAQVLINDAYWKHDIAPGNELEPLQSATIEVIYPWVEGDTEHITLISRSGVTFSTEVAVATFTPKFNWLYLKRFIFLGIYVGVIPVLLGLLWFPFLRRLKGRWYDFLLSLTIGLLVFLGFDALGEAFELIGQVPNSLNGTGILVIGFLLAIITLSAVSYKTERFVKEKGEAYKALLFAYMIALGIGIHNLGEGLAIGSAYAIGEIALGSTLVLGFMIHNVTEGIAIVSPLTNASERVRKFVTHVILMGLIAGIPAIIGAVIGGFSYSAALAVFFLAIGSGAIFDVAFDISHHMARGRWLSLFTIPNVLGFLAGVLIMYATGFLVI